MEKRQQHDGLHNIRELEDKINSIFEEINSEVLERPFFLPDDPPILNGMSEMKFRKMISYLYKLFVERSCGNFKILIDFSSSVGMNKDIMLGITRTVHDFRTMFEHFLIPEDKHSIDIESRCLLWYRSILFKNCPENDEEWEKCFYELSKETSTCLENAVTVLTELKDKDESFIYEQWAARQKRNIPKHRIISFFERIKIQYDMPYDSRVLYNKYQGRIDGILNLLDYSISVTELDCRIYKTLETFVLSVKEFPCPLSGKEVEEKYNIHGKELGELMKKVTIYYKSDSRIHTKESLYEYIEANRLIGQ